MNKSEERKIKLLKEKYNIVPYTLYPYKYVRDYFAVFGYTLLSKKYVKCANKLKSKRQAIATERALGSVSEIEKMALGAEKEVMSKGIVPWQLNLLKVDQR